MLDRDALEVPLACDRGNRCVEETEVLGNASAKPHAEHRLCTREVFRRLEDSVEAEQRHRLHRQTEERVVGVADPEHPAAATTFCVEDAGQKPFAPLQRGFVWELDRLDDSLVTRACMRPDCPHRLIADTRRLEVILVRLDGQLGEVSLGAVERLEVNHRETKLVLDVAAFASATAVVVGPQ